MATDFIKKCMEDEQKIVIIRTHEILLKLLDRDIDTRSKSNLLKIC